MAGGDLLNIGVSGLQAFQNSLNTIGHNIANVNTEGYSRQSVDLVSRLPQANGFGFIGSGVDTVTIKRSYDAFVESSVRSGTSSTAEFLAFHALASQLDNVLADSDTGMNAALQRFFNAVQDVADSPSTPAVRQVLFNEAQQLTEQFNELAEWIEGVRGQVNSRLRGSVDEINRISQVIANLNEAIVLEQGRSGGQPANDLLDQRDAMIRDLSELVSVTTIQQDDGAVNVMIGTGQLLVRGNNIFTLEVFNEVGDPNQLGISLTAGNGTPVDVTKQLSGGSIGGVLGFRDRMLDQAINTLGLVAIGMSHFINEQHHQGMDLDGVLGNDFFNVPQPEVLTLSGAPAKVSVTFDDYAQLTNADYNLKFNAGVWQLTRKDTGQSIAMTGTGTAADPFIAEGLQFEITAAPVNGDNYLIRPTRNGAADIKMVLGSTRQIAAAAPIRSQAATNNIGSGAISAGLITDINNPVFQTTANQLAPPLLIRFNNATSYDIFDNTNPASPVLLEAAIAYNPATGSVLFPTPGGLDHGYQMQLAGAPVAGDEFSIEYNNGGTGDNRNALLLAALSTDKLMNAGSASFSGVYLGLVAEVGSGTQQAELNSLAQQRLLERAVATRESISGVNLDEEAANLIRYQQAYQASAQVISIASSLFATLLNAVDR